MRNDEAMRVTDNNQIQQIESINDCNSEVENDFRSEFLRLENTILELIRQQGEEIYVNSECIDKIILELKKRKPEAPQELLDLVYQFLLSYYF